MTSRGRWGTRRAAIETGTALHLDRYRIEGILGKGGEGIVYRAFDGARRHHVALKVLHVDDASAIPQLKREFRFLRDLIHPGLVPLYELVVEAGLSFYTMALVDGRNFHEVSKSVEDLRKHVLQLADVLAFLHATGRVHRDIKPSNVIVRPDGQLVLVDFGIGVQLSDKPRAEGVLGTPPYMAPEQLALLQPSAKTDAFSVGVMLFEALTGSHPEPNGLPNPMRETPPDVKQRKPDVPDDLAELCRGLLEPNPDKRLGMADVVLRLSTSLSGEPPHRRAPPSAGTPAAFAGRSLELSRLEEALERVREQGDAVLAILEAPSGLGKTATLNRFLRAHPESLILRGRCSEHELLAHKAIDGVVECLFDYLEELEEYERQQLVPRQDAQLLEQLFPELSQRAGPRTTPSVEVPTPGDMRALRVKAYQALARVLHRLAEREPLIVAIDDLQWGDVDSGKLLFEIFSGSERPRCLLVLAHRRDGTTSACLRELFGLDRKLSDGLVTTRLQLFPLTEKEATELVKAHLEAALQPGQPAPQSELVEKVVAEGDGSPLLLTELASHLAARLVRGSSAHDLLSPHTTSVGLDEIVRERCRSISATSNQAFQLLCCSGTTIEVRQLAELVKGDPDSLVRELEIARLARQRSGGMELEVVHDAIREATLRAVADALPRLHERLARSLEVDRGDPAKIARHFAEAGLPKSSSHWAEIAGDSASRSLALDHAVQMYRLALRGATEGSQRTLALREKLANALADAGFGREAAPLFAELAQSAEGDRALSFRARAAEQWLITGDARRGSEVLREVQEVVGLPWPTTANDALRTLLWERARVSLMKLSPGVRKPSASKDLLPKLEACRAAWSVSFISTIHGAANASRYLRLALQSGDRQHLAIGYGMEAMYLASLGAPARKRADRALEQCKRLMPPAEGGYNAAFLKYASGQCAFLLGDFLEALRGYSNAEAAFLESCRNVSWELNSGRIFLGNVLFELGRHRELDQRYAEWLADAEERGDSYMGAAIPIAQARRAMIRTGRLEEANRLIAEGASRWTSPYMGFHHFSAIVCRSLVGLMAQRPTEVLQLLDAGLKELHATRISRVQILRVHFETHAAYAAIELAADAKSKRERHHYLHLAREQAAKLWSERTPRTSARARLIEASADLIEYPTEEAILTLRQVEKSLSDIGHELESAAVGARLSEIVGGDEGLRLQREAHARFLEAEATDWTHALSAFAPRFLPQK